MSHCYDKSSQQHVASGHILHIITPLQSLLTFTVQDFNFFILIKSWLVLKLFEVRKVCHPHTSSVYNH